MDKEKLYQANLKLVDRNKEITNDIRTLIKFVKSLGKELPQEVNNIVEIYNRGYYDKKL